MSEQLQRLEAIVVQIGEAVVASANTVENLAIQIKAIANYLQQQEQQIQQQGYQLFALSETLQTLIDGQKASAQQINQLHQTVQTLINNSKSTDNQIWFFIAIYHQFC